MGSDDQSDPIFVNILLILLGFIFLGVVGRVLIMNSALIYSCFNLYKKALLAVSKTKQEFFDSNPSGRILNRFSRDTYLMDYQMP